MARGAVATVGAGVARGALVDRRPPELLVRSLTRRGGEEAGGRGGLPRREVVVPAGRGRDQSVLWRSGPKPIMSVPGGFVNGAARGSSRMG